MKKLSLNENFICRIWEDSSNYSGLKTNEGLKVGIIDLGKRNNDAGPDYIGSKIKIGGQIMTGSVEIHRTMDDWFMHNHGSDRKYNDLILHVVLYNDLYSENKRAVVSSERVVPTVVLSDFLTRSIHEIWKDIINKPSESFKLPCFPANMEIHFEDKAGFVKRLGLERLKLKSEKFRERIYELKKFRKDESNPEQAFFEYLCEALGYSKNKQQFIALSRKIEIERVKELDLSAADTEALMFGLSGFLSDRTSEDEYSDDLFERWTRIRRLLKKEEMFRSEWNFFRLRPPNFPTLRIAYASAVLHELVMNDFYGRMRNEFEESKDILKSMTGLFHEVKISRYWKDHYSFGKRSQRENKGIGEDRIKDIISNVIFPMMYFTASDTGNGNLMNKVEYFYRNNRQKAPVNEVSKVMQEQLGISSVNPAVEQGLIHLHKFFCVKGKCSSCSIGRIVFGEEGVHEPLKIIIY
ncbi:MAG: DUF2851 family protein [Bacteroidetes bacterium]|nr:DUF2851 family protein [Bacteroidota bacterium]